MAEFEIISGSHNATPSPRTLCTTRGMHCEWTRVRMHQCYTPAPHPYVRVRSCTSLLHYIQAQDHPAVTHGQPAPSSLALNHKRNPEDFTTLTHVHDTALYLDTIGGKEDVCGHEIAVG